MPQIIAAGIIVLGLMALSDDIGSYMAKHSAAVAHCGKPQK